MLWLFARLARAGYRVPEMREGATHGYRFLIDRMWDRQHGGYVWEVDESGARVIDAAKVIYGESFALYALSEYARATGDAGALSHATEMFELIDARAHDATYGGYFEAVRAGLVRAARHRSRRRSAARAGAKLMNTHLHLLEAFAEYTARAIPPSPLTRSGVQTLDEVSNLLRRARCCRGARPSRRAESSRVFAERPFPIRSSECGVRK